MNLAEQVLYNASVRYAKALRRGRQRNQEPRVRKPSEKPWNRLEAFADMCLYMCPSVKEKLRELDERDWEAKHGRKV